MSRMVNQKMKLIRILEILRHESDEENPISTKELIQKLEDMGIPADRKTIYDDINVLNDNGYEIVTVRKKNNCYYIVDRAFDEVELKILVDAVRSAKFITEKKSKALIEKLALEAGEHRGDILKRETVFDTVKQKNEHIFYNIDTITNAIHKGKDITFQYYSINYKHKAEYRKDGGLYSVSPVALTFNDGCYYLVSYMAKYNSIVNYRVDRMEKVTLSTEDSNVPKKFTDVKSNVKQQFSMYNGDVRDIVLEVGKNVVEPIIDKFGDRVIFGPLPNEKYKVVLTLQVSPTFYGWCAIFGDNLQITSPADIRKEYASHIQKILSVNS